MAKNLLVGVILSVVIGLGTSCENQKLGKSQYDPGQSCRQIYDCNPASQGVSGYYWIKTDRSRVKNVYCDMKLTCGGTRGGWMRIANLDTTHGDGCPGGWKKIFNPRPLCRGSGDAAGCYSAYFTSYKVKYNSICGKLKGYQQGSHAGFLSEFAPSKSIDGPYLDGVSITVGTPRKHVWSYAVGYSKSSSGSKVNCPCAKHRGTSPPSFVKEHYYCESGASDSPDLTTFYGSDPLWDGKDCPAGDNCCSALEAPWFYRYFVEAKDGAVEVRICRDEVYSNEATLMEQVELYIQ